jgi:succinoglycan biosynthesis protein ExoV
MILYHWQGHASNFGDELNTLLWPALMPGFFDANPEVRFLGIGSVLDRRHDGPALKIVAGSGFGGYERKAKLDETWIIHWVRGPWTAAQLGIDPKLALGDPAALVPDALNLERRSGLDVGFMPHFESMERGTWRQAAAMAGVRLIDPRDPPEAILDTIASCRLILSEALHGVIVADALRVPWIAVRPLARIHRPKWYDWAATMELKPRFNPLPASTLHEWMLSGMLPRYPGPRPWLEPAVQAASNARRTERAAEALCRMTEAEPQLSSDSALDQCQSRQYDALVALRRAPVPVWAMPANAPSKQSRLRDDVDSAYQIPVIG